MTATIPDHSAVKKLVLSLFDNKENEADPLIQSLIELSSRERMAQLAPNLIADGYMAIHVFLDSDDDSDDGDEKSLSITRIKREERWDAKHRNRSLDESVNESSGAFRWLNRDLKAIKEAGGACYEFSPETMKAFIKNIIIAAMFFVEYRLKDHEDNIAFSLLSDAIPKDNILIIFSRGTLSDRTIERVWFVH